METLTESLTQQLGFDLTAAVETKRRLTVGSSFIDKKTTSESFLGLQFGGEQKKNENQILEQEAKHSPSPFGKVA